MMCYHCSFEGHITGLGSGAGSITSTAMTAFLKLGAVGGVGMVRYLEATVVSTDVSMSRLTAALSLFLPLWACFPNNLSNVISSLVEHE